MLLGDRLSVPAGTAAILFDMDGVLLDSLTMDYEIVNRLVESHASGTVDVPRAVIRANFPFDLPVFWRRVLGEIHLDLDSSKIDLLVAAHERERATTKVPVHEGIAEILADARRRRLSLGVVSNNPEGDVEQMIKMAGIRKFFDVVVGNDGDGLAKKPAPDIYIAAARRLGVAPGSCVAVEDSLVGAESASRAGCHTVGVATGATAFDDLASSEWVDSSYSYFGESRVRLRPGDVTSKSLRTPNDFVSHMIEHVAWRTGCSVDVSWTTNDWRQLGCEVGREIAGLPRVRQGVSVLGMIDDGSCEVAVRRADGGGAVFRASSQVDLDWFLSLRCEQLSHGGPLVSLADGIAAGAEADIDVTVASLEDPHHTWEGIFRAIGIGFEKLGHQSPDMRGATPAAVSNNVAQYRSPGGKSDEAEVERGWTVLHSSDTRSELRRETAESIVGVVAELGRAEARLRLDVSDSIDVLGAADLLDEFAVGAVLGLDIEFRATRLNSSHVVLEDLGLAVGHALKRIAVARMTRIGIYGAGSNVEAIEDLTEKPVRVGISLEGRKFWKYVPFGRSYDDFRKEFLVGHKLPNGLFTEDLDDFIDGLAGGLQASVVVHVDRDTPPGLGWPLVFRGLGEAMAELLAENPSRKALTPGVKATLA
jgi:HAD superfamily hydrolase (TIGR01509 family)